MKKEIIFLFILLLIPTVLAINIDLSKSSYNPQETLQAEITGNFISFTSDNILIYKQDAVHSTPVVSDLTKQGDTYYFYAVLPSQEDNFTLKIEDAQYIESGTSKTDTITQDFTIAKTNESLLSINKGFITTSRDFSVKITCLNNNQDISAELELTGETKDIFLIQDADTTLTFEVSEQESATTNLKINEYNIPVFLTGKTEVEESEINQTNQTREDNETKINIENKTDKEIKALRCSDIGIKCESNEKCDGEKVESLDGPCCIGECKKKEESKIGLYIGISLIILVLLAGLFLYLKSRKYIKPKSTEDFLKDKAKKFSERMGEQVTGNVTRS